jgi:hypothetical protein
MKPPPEYEPSPELVKNAELSQSMTIWEKKIPFPKALKQKIKSRRLSIRSGR